MSNGRWDPINKDARQADKLWSRPTSYARDVAYSLFHNKLAVVSLVFIFLLVLFAAFGPLVARHTYFDQNLGAVNLPPRMNAAQVDGRYFYLSRALTIVELDSQGELMGVFRIESENMAELENYYDVDGQKVIVSYKEKPAALLNAQGERVLPSKKLYNKTYVLGTDNLGRDILVRLMYGARISLLVALIAAVVNFFIGVLYGGISAYVGGNVDNIMMRIVDIISTVPLTLYVILIMVVLNSSGFLSIIIALGSVYWVGMARVVRGQILSLKEQEYVMAAKTIGTSGFNILIRHLIPNALGSIVVTVTMLIPSAIFTESFLSFIGLGVSAPMASWGTLCADALEGLKASPYQLIIPAVAICLTMFSFNFLGDGLRDALDPKMKK